MLILTYYLLNLMSKDEFKQFNRNMQLTFILNLFSTINSDHIYNFSAAAESLLQILSIGNNLLVCLNN